MKQRGLKIIKLLAMTLVPSGVFTAFYIASGWFWRGIPSLALFCVVAVPTLFLFEMVVVLYANKKEYGSYGVQIAFIENEKTVWWKTFFYGFLLFSFAGLMTVTIAPLENTPMAEAFQKINSILPAYFDWNNFELMKQYSKGTLLFTSVLYIITNVFIGPIIEEIYFRGYLTSRLKDFGIAAPILITIVFSLYHWWLPFNNVFRICAFTVAAVIAYRKKNIYITMVFHCLCNLFSSISFIMTLWG